MSKKPSPLSRPLPNASLPRNTFDRSFMINFNQSAGMLIPVFSQFLPLGSHAKINRSVFMRCAQLNTASFPELDYNIDFFCVPIKLLFTRYDEFKTNTQDINSSSFANTDETLNTVPSRLPYFKRSDYLAFANNLSVDYDIFGFPWLYGAERLFDFLGYDDATLNDVFDPTYDVELNALRLLAYQKVYYDHYRNSAYEVNDPFAYNADHYYSSGANGYISDASVLRKISMLHYIDYRKDYFTAIYPSLQYVSSGVQSQLNAWNLPNSFVQAGYTPTSYTIGLTGTTGKDSQRWIKFNGDPVPASQSVSSDTPGSTLAVPGSKIVHDHTVNGYGIASQNAGLYNTQAIRAAFALDKLLRASAYAPKHVKDQLEARYGVSLRKSYGNESIKLGSFGNRISIGEVTSTANTVSGMNGDELGAIGGKGVSGSSSGKTIEFDVESDSIVVGVAYMTVRSFYDSHRYDCFNMKHLKEDLPIPEFMDLGLKPVTVQEIYNQYDSVKNNHIFGYQTRDQEYKVGIDTNHGLFRANEPLSPFTIRNNSHTRLFNGGVFTAPTASYFKVSPYDLNDIFAQAFDPSHQDTDQVFGQIRFDFVTRQNMSVHGQPKL